MTTIGVVTIGQAPRADLGPVFRRYANRAGVTVIERGALDGLRDEEILRDCAPGPEDTTYVTLLASGKSVRVAKRSLVPRMQAHLDALSENCAAIVVACTGEFPTLEAETTLFFSDRILVEAARERGISHSLGLVVPLAEQAADIAAKWTLPGVVVHTEPVSPYDGGDMVEAVAKLGAHHPELIVLDCIGFTAEHGAEAASASGGVEVLVPQEFVPETVINWVRAGGAVQ